MAHCYASHGAHCTPASPKPSKASSQTSPRTSPEFLARHFTEAGLIEKAAGLWGKAGQRSLERSALVEAVAQLTRALDQIATLPRRLRCGASRSNFKSALITPLMHVKGYAAPETKAAVERARLLIEQAEALGETPEDPLLLFSVLYGFCTANYAAFNGDVCRDLAAHSWHSLRSKERPSRLIGHRIMGCVLNDRGDIAEGEGHYDQAIALYDPPSIARWRPDLVKTRSGDP